MDSIQFIEDADIIYRQIACPTHGGMVNGRVKINWQSFQFQESNGRCESVFCQRLLKDSENLHAMGSRWIAEQNANLKEGQTQKKYLGNTGSYAGNVRKIEESDSGGNFKFTVFHSPEDCYAHCHIQLTYLKTEISNKKSRRKAFIEKLKECFTMDDFINEI